MKKEERIDKQRKKQEKYIESQQRKEDILAAIEMKDHEHLDVCTVDVQQEETTQNRPDRNAEAIQLNLTQLWISLKWFTWCLFAEGKCHTKIA